MPFLRRQVSIMEKNKLIESVLALGAHRAGIVATGEIVLDRVFRDICAANACGMFGKCWMCPPDVGDIDRLMAEVGTYDFALVYQTVNQLEDSFDYEGMVDARKQLYALSQQIRRAFDEMGVKGSLHLSAGGCGVCQKCAKQIGEPCRFPDRAMPSLESYGIHVAELARSAGMKYTNGPDTVTYFGAVLFSADGDRDE